MIKKGFTLVELLVVVVVIAILLAVSFRIMGAGEEETSRSLTVRRLHALETCISGYFAAFGSYPPVRLHGSRNIYCKLNMQGGQIVDKEPEDDKIESKRVKAACRSQPVAMNFPFRESDWEAIEKASYQLQNMFKNNKGGVVEAAKTGFDGLRTPQQLSGKSDEDRWTHLNLFRFGLMSFLLPRFMFMMQGPDVTVYDKFTQWGDNNNIPCRFEDGVPYESWEEIAKQVRPPSNPGNQINDELWKVALLPSQLITARWVACLERCCHSQRLNPGKIMVWGVDILGEDQSDLSESGMTVDGRYPPVFSSGDLQSENNDWTQAYALDGISCRDGWGEELYYYSPPPHQGYRLWSSGPNTETFPPWITDKEIDELKGNDAKMVRAWKADDLVHTSN
jgi:prepilin-type N-terminal cleavage/methylation domain-containing protein